MHLPVHVYNITTENKMLLCLLNVKYQSIRTKISLAEITFKPLCAVFD